MIKREDFTIDSRDGRTKLHAVKWLPESEPECILQIIHGMNDHVMSYDEMARYMAQRGILVVGDDHLGHGGSVPEGGQQGYFCETDGATVLVRDEHRLKKTMQQQYPNVPYLIFGHSAGSFILRNYLIQYGSGINGAIICATATPARGQLVFGKAVAGLLEKMHGGRYISKFVDWTAKRAHCGGFLFSVNAYHALFELADRMQNKKELVKMPKKLPILIVAGTDDPVGESGKAPQELYDEFLNMDMTKVTLKLYNGCRNELHNEPVRENFFLDIYNWISFVLVNMK